MSAKDLFSVSMVGVIAVGLTSYGCSFGDPDDIDEDDSTSTSSSSSSNSSNNSTTTSSTTGGSTTTSTGSGGSTTATSTTGSGGTGGGALECDDVTGTPGVECSTVDPGSFGTCCERCTLTNCCDEYAACYAVEPYHVCAGDADGNDSEVNCIIDCMVTEEDLELCAGQCAEDVSASVCSLGTISGATNDLVSCISGDENMLNGCWEECFTDFDEEACLY